MDTTKTCISCGRDLVLKDHVWLCPNCNSAELAEQTFLSFETAESEQYVYIECPGATLYEPGTTNIVQGVQFDDESANGNYTIIDRPVYAPTHTRRRRIKREAVGKIRRCQGCQDYTVRMRRPEGPDFFIPSNKYPNRKKLKSVTHHSTA